MEVKTIYYREGIPLAGHAAVWAFLKKYPGAKVVRTKGDIDTIGSPIFFAGDSVSILGTNDVAQTAWEHCFPGEPMPKTLKALDVAACYRVTANDIPKPCIYEFATKLVLLGCGQWSGFDVLAEMRIMDVLEAFGDTALKHCKDIQYDLIRREKRNRNRREAGFIAELYDCYYTADTIVEGRHCRAYPTGWTICGEIDSSEGRVYEFEATHLEHGRVWGVFGDEVYATTETAWLRLKQDHRPNDYYDD